MPDLSVPAMDSKEDSEDSSDESFDGAQDIATVSTDDVFDSLTCNTQDKANEDGPIDVKSYQFDDICADECFDGDFVSIKISVASSIGTRDTMEDEHYVKAGDVTFVGIYDGHNGGECSEFLKQKLAQKSSPQCALRRQLKRMWTSTPLFYLPASKIPMKGCQDLTRVRQQYLPSSKMLKLL